MAVPKKRTSASRRDMRRSHDFFTAVQNITCSNCGEPVRMHRVCTSCGTYRGKQIIKQEAPAIPETPTQA